MRTKKSKYTTGRFGGGIAIIVGILIVFVLIIAGWYFTQPKTPGNQLTSAQCLEKLPLSFLTGQVLMVGLPGDDLAPQAPVFAKYHIGSAAVMSSPKNPYDGGIVRFKNAGGSFGVPLLISTDEEGGRVQRFRSLGVLPSQQKVANTLTPAQARELIAKHGKKLKAAGIDMILGPLADVAPAYGTSTLGDRVFSSDPETVKKYDLAYIRGWESAGLLPTLKHFPGLGAATGNTDYGPATTPPFSQLKERAFVPYQGLAKTGTAVMVGNQVVPDWITVPASLSPKVDTYLREELGYNQNLIITDALNAKAITDIMAESEAVVKAIVAGNDIALVVEGSGNPTKVGALFSQIQTALQTAVQKGTISKHRLIEAVLAKLSAQGISACSIQEP